jgi:MFS transporter, FSR family, fosmidomycin resistance protein
MTVGICGPALAGFFVGLSQNLWMMLILLALMGLLAGGYHPAAPALISASVKPEYRGRALGLHLVGGAASFFLAPLIAVAIASYGGWRSSFLVLAVITLAFGIFFYVALGRRTTGGGVEKKRAASLTESPGGPGRRFHLGVFIFMSTFCGALLLSVMSFIPLYLVDRLGFSKETAGALYAFIYSAGLWASPLGGYLSDRLGAVPVILAVLFVAGPAAYLLNFVSSWLGIGALLLLIGMIIYVRMPVSEAYIISKTSERNRSTILGIYFFGNMEGSGLLAPLMGYMIDHLGFYLSFSIAAIALVVVTSACSLLLRSSAK